MVPTGGRAKTKGQARSQAKRRWFGREAAPVRFVLLAAFTTVALTGLLFSVFGLEPETVLQAGEPSPRTFQAPLDIEVEDQALTERQRISAREQVDTIYAADVPLQQLMRNLIASANLPAEAQTELIQAYNEPDGVSEAEREELIRRAVAATIPERQQAVRLLLDTQLLSTSVPNDELTAAARNAAAEAVRPVPRLLPAGEVIVAEGDVLDEEALRVLADAGLYNARTEASNRVMQTFLSALLLAFVFTLPLVYLARHQRGLSFSQLAFLVLLTLTILAAQRAAFLIDPTFLFISIVPLLVAVLVSELAGVIWATWLGVLLTILEPSIPLFVLTISLTGGVGSAIIARVLKSRSSVFFAGLLGGLFAGVGYVLLLFMLGNTLTFSTLSDVGLILGGGLLAGIVALGLLPLAESTFDFLTDFRLAELSNPSTPLLQRLLLEAPGTYQHSLIISNLVEQAVTNIGGNALLARVGSMYHDVGKMKRPQFFVENQVSGANPHDQISPHLSYLIITSHVRDGLELLREYKLPKTLFPFVASHHGTTVLSYFYKQALEESDDLDELNFRYPGPKPKTKETAVLMLADAVESASRTLSEPSQSSIRALIDRLIETRLQDGQLAESPLNLRDLEIIANTFERMLTAILHRRISYPSTEEIRSLERGGAARRNQPLPSS